MRNGTIRRRDGKPYIAVGDYVKDLKAMWHWHIKVERKRGNLIMDICVDLDRTKPKPTWVYLTEEQVRLLCQHANFKYRTLIMFLYDSGIRAPTELLNIRVGDFSENFSKLLIREEVSKTFGRKINLLLCPPLVRDYVKFENLSTGDALFASNHVVLNRCLRRLAVRVLGGEVSPGGERYSMLSLYDFRHSSACFWLPKYKSESGLKYRFGWKKSEQIHYYTELLGMSDTITTDDLVSPPNG